MKLPKELTTVTPFSKLMALFLFLFFTLSGFLFGMKYQELLDISNQQTSQTPTVPVPTPNQIANQVQTETNWKIYRNIKYNFNVSYPPDWIVEEIDPYGEEIFNLEITQKNTYPGYPFRIAIFSNPNSLSLNLWIKEYMKQSIKENQLAGSIYNNPTIKSILLDNEIAKEFGLFSFDYPSSKAIVSIRNSRIYWLQFAEIDSSRNSNEQENYYKDYKQRTDQILQTFKFTDQTVSNAVSGKESP